MDPYDSPETPTCMIEQLEKGREFSCAGGLMIYDKIMVSKGIIFLAQTSKFNKDIIEWRWQTT